MTKILLAFLGLNYLFSETQNIEHITETKVQSESYIMKQIKNNLKKEYQKFFKKYQYGHNLNELSKIKEGQSRYMVHNILGSPLNIKTNPKIDYYLAQTCKKRFAMMFYGEGIIIRIQYKNNKVEKILKIPLKKKQPSIPIDRIENKLNKKIEQTNIEF